MVSQLLDLATGDRPLFRFWPLWSEQLLIVVSAAVGSALAIWSLRPWNLAVLNFSVAALLLAALGYGLFLSHVWIPIAAAFVSLVGSYITQVIYQLQQARARQDMVMRLLGQQTSPEIAEALWTDRFNLLSEGQLPGKQITATILFTDLRGFSTLAEQQTPVQLMGWLNRYLARMTRIVLRHHGIVNKFTGDGLMAVFGVPIPSETREAIAADARNALTCALDMDRDLQEINRDNQQQAFPQVQMRIGIYTGSIMVGSLGGAERLEYGVIGDSVNIASRLESYAKERQPTDCRTLIAAETLAYLDPTEFQLENWGFGDLKGKYMQVEIYRLLGQQKPEP
jgi:adenylate cyclase